MVKVSIIITTYGKPVFLEKAIKSVLNQTFKDIELIIVDDNNPDTEARILTEGMVTRLNNTKQKIIYIKHKYNKNGAVARNTGFSAAKGKYISLLDNDDEYYPERIAKCFSKMEQCPDKIAGVYTGCEFRRGGKIYSVKKNVKAGNFLVSTLAATFLFGTGSNFFFRKSVVDDLDGFDEAFLRHQDYEFLVRVFEKYNIEAIPEVLVIKNNENLNLPNVNKMIDIKAQYLDKFKTTIQGLQRADRKYIYHKQYVSIAEHALRTKQLSIAKDYYMYAKEYGSLTIKEMFRKRIFTILNIIH
jgi:glycosyltransferase involved in cell wall biosynthesis